MRACAWWTPSRACWWSGRYSKIYGLSGLRAGYAVSSDARLLAAAAPVLGVNALSQAAVEHALQHGDAEIERRRHAVVARAPLPNRPAARARRGRDRQPGQLPLDPTRRPERRRAGERPPPAGRNSCAGRPARRGPPHTRGRAQRAGVEAPAARDREPALGRLRRRSGGRPGRHAAGPGRRRPPRSPAAGGARRALRPAHPALRHLLLRVTRLTARVPVLPVFAPRIRFTRSTRLISTGSWKGLGKLGIAENEKIGNPLGTGIERRVVDLAAQRAGERPVPKDRLIGDLAGRQYGVVSRSQLLAMGIGAGAIQHARAQATTSTGSTGAYTRLATWRLCRSRARWPRCWRAGQRRRNQPSLGGRGVAPAARRSMTRRST